MAKAMLQYDTIMAELRDTNKDKRRTAVMKLGMLGDERAVDALIRILDNEYEDVLVRSRAAMLLGRIGGDRAVMPLIRALDASGYQTPVNAVQSLGPHWRPACRRAAAAPGRHQQRPSARRNSRCARQAGCTGRGRTAHEHIRRARWCRA